MKWESKDSKKEKSVNTTFLLHFHFTFEPEKCRNEY